MLKQWKTFEVNFWNWMRQSGTIAWARLQVLIGVIFAVLSTTDVSPLFGNHPMLLVWYLMIVGAVTEYIRRRGTEVQITTSYIQDVGNMQVKTLMPAPPPKG